MKSFDAQIACAQREVGMRKRVYPKWVVSGKMQQSKADEEIATMEDIVETLTIAKQIAEFAAQHKASIAYYPSLAKEQT